MVTPVSETADGGPADGPTGPDPLTVLARAQPEAPAVIEGERRLTYAGLEALANRYAHVLQDLGVEAGTKVAWCGRNSLEVVALIAAIRKTGSVGVPLNYRLSPEEASYVVENSDAEVVLFDTEQTEQLARAAREVDRVERWLALRGGDAPPWAGSLQQSAEGASTEPVTPVGTDPAQGSAMFYTSGTTGRPKGVVRGRTDPDLLARLAREIGYLPGDVYLTTGPLYHSGPQSFMLIVMQVGRLGRRPRPVRPAALARARRAAPGDDDVLRPDPRPTCARPAGRGAAAGGHVVAAAGRRERGALALRAEAPLRRRVR